MEWRKEGALRADKPREKERDVYFVLRIVTRVYVTRLVSGSITRYWAVRG